MSPLGPMLASLSLSSGAPVISSSDQSPVREIASSGQLSAPRRADSASPEGTVTATTSPRPSSSGSNTTGART